MFLQQLFFDRYFFSVGTAEYHLPPPPLGCTPENISNSEISHPVDAVHSQHTTHNTHLPGYGYTGT